MDTLAFNDKTWLDSKGLPHTDALHGVGRIRRVARNTVQDEITIEDSKAYTSPWTAQKFSILKPKRGIQEYACAENNTYHWPVIIANTRSPRADFCLVDHSESTLRGLKASLAKTFAETRLSKCVTVLYFAESKFRETL